MCKMVPDTELQVQSKLSCTPGTEKVGNYFLVNPLAVVCHINAAQLSVLGIAARQQQDLTQGSGTSFGRIPKCELIVTPDVLWLCVKLSEIYFATSSLQIDWIQLGELVRFLPIGIVTPNFINYGFVWAAVTRQLSETPASGFACRAWCLPKIQACFQLSRWHPPRVLMTPSPGVTTGLKSESYCTVSLCTSGCP